MSQSGITVESMSRKKTMRPPYLSVHMPSGMRISAPVSTGVAVSRPNWVALSPSSCLIGTPITPNIIQMAKQTVKASVLMIATCHCLAFRLAPLCVCAWTCWGELLMEGGLCDG